MQRVTRSVLVGYSDAAMFDLVAAVPDYPEFLPWCGGTQVLAEGPDSMTARVDIDYHGVRAHFTTENTHRRPASIVVTLKDGPFRHLHGEWQFKALGDAACKVELLLAYEFATAVLDRVIGPVFNHIAHTFIDAFVRRADACTAPVRRANRRPRAVAEGDPVDPRPGRDGLSEQAVPRVTVAHVGGPLPAAQAVVAVELPAPATVAEAVERSGLLARIGTGADIAFAVFGRRVDPGDALADGDRVELTRPLRVDAGTARRLRARARPARHIRAGVLRQDKPSN